MNKLYVIGIGYKPLDKRAREIILSSDIILASNRLFEVFKGYEEFGAVKDRIKVINNVNQTFEFISSELRTPNGSTELAEVSKLQTIVLLASGDPMFFGIGRRTVREFGKDVVEILPDLSSIPIAFSRIKEPWDDAFLISLHGGPDPEKRRRLPYEIEDIPFLLQQHNKIAVLTDRENNPSAIADVIVRSRIPCLSSRGVPNEVRELRSNLKTGSEQASQSNYFEIASLAARNDSVTMYVCEKLGYPDEKIIEGTAGEIAEMTFSEPNVVIIQKTSPPPPHPLPQGEGDSFDIPSPSRGEGKGEGESLASEIRFGLKENEFLHSRGLITKDEVRSVTIHKLKLPQKGIFWDIGAGSGSVSLEAAKLHQELKVFAIEKGEEQIKNIEENRSRFNTPNIEIIRGEAPDALVNLPSPDRIFIGGSSGRLAGIIDFIAKMPTTIVVINATTIETLNEAIKHLENNGFNINISEVSISRSKIIANRRHMQALNPVFVITGEK